MAHHVAEENIRAGIVGGIRLGESLGMLGDADLTSKADAKAAVNADQAKMHSAESNFGARVNASLDIVDSYLPGYTSGGDVSDVEDVSPNSGAGRSLRF